VQPQMNNKHNIVLYVDQELVEKSRNLGFNLSKTFENHLKHLLTQFSQVNSSNNIENNDNQNEWWAGPDLNRRPLARKANVLTKLDDRPSSFS
jgi:post-segregation antitoxin (ccd killing protein)